MQKLQYFGHLMQRPDWLEKTLMLGDGKRRSGQQRMRWLEGITDSMSKLWEMVEEGKPSVLQSIGLQRIGHNLATQ